MYISKAQYSENSYWVLFVNHWQRGQLALFQSLELADTTQTVNVMNLDHVEWDYHFYQEWEDNLYQEWEEEEWEEKEWSPKSAEEWKEAPEWKWIPKWNNRLILDNCMDKLWKNLEWT